MRHRRHQYRFNRTSEHQLALRRNLAQSLIEHGQITTTLPKARDVSAFAERAVTLAVTARKRADAKDAAGALRARRILARMLNDRSIIPKEKRGDYIGMSDSDRDRTLRALNGRRYRTGEPRGRLEFTGESVLHRLMEKVAPKFMDRPGGYTRVIRLPDRRVGDGGELAIVQFVGGEEAPRSLTKPARSARQRRSEARYRLAAQMAKGGPKARAADE